MSDQTLFCLSIFGIVSLLAWWVLGRLAPSDGGRLRQRLRAQEYDPRLRPSALGKITDFFEQIGQAAASPFMPKNREAQSLLRRRLAYAGIYSPSAVRLVIGCKVLLLAGGLVGGYLAGAVVGNVLGGVSFGGIVGYLLPAFWIKVRIKQHQTALQQGLPDALDLLVVCVEAGLTVDAAMQRVGQELKLAHPHLAHELDLTHMETRIGLPRSDALRNLGTRTGNPAVQTLSSMLIQAERFGTSIAAALRIQADSLRAARQHAAEEQAAKASVKLTFPVILFIFPAVLIVLAGPAIIGLFKSALFAD